MRALSFVASIFATVASASAEPLDVPPGQDPGGIAIGLLSPKLDLQSPELQAALARDGEGVAIGWDFSSPDAELPAPAPDDANAGAVAQTETLRVLGGAGTRVVSAFVAPKKPTSWAQAIAFLAKTPAQIIVVQTSSSIATDWTGFAAAAQHFNTLLFIVPAHPDGASDQTGLFYPAALNLANVVSVSVGPGKSGDAQVVRNGSPPSLAAALGLVARTLVLCGQTSGPEELVLTKTEALKTLRASTGGDQPKPTAPSPVPVTPCSAAANR